MSTAKDAWDEGFAAGLLYSKQAWWRVPRPKNPYPKVDNSDIDERERNEDSNSAG